MRHFKMCYFRRILASIFAKGRITQLIQTASPTPSNSTLLTANPQRPRPPAAAGHLHLVFEHPTKAASPATAKSARQDCPPDNGNKKQMMNTILALSSPKITHQDVCLADKIEGALALFDNEAWLSGHPQHNTLYTFLNDVAQRLVMVPAHLGLSLCEALVEDALVCLQDCSDSYFDAFDMCMEVYLEQSDMIMKVHFDQVCEILKDLSTYTKQYT